MMYTMNRRTQIFLIGLCLSLCALAATIFPTHAQTASPESDGVINTNFPNPGDTKPSPAIRILPGVSYGSYSNMSTDPVAISAAERDTLLAAASKTASGIKMISLNNWDAVQEGQPAIQIVNNVPIKGATYTIVLPPGWKRSAHYPVLLSGNGAGVSNNARLWKGSDTSLINAIALASTRDRSGLIAAYSNAGGTESQGVDDHTYKSVGAFFDFIGQNGGDPMHAIMAGGSRGGGTALMWAINPLDLNYKVVAVFADIPPTAYGTLSQLSVLTYPNLGYINEALVHDPNAYLYSNPNGPSNSHIGLLIGVNDAAGADAKSPIGMAERLKDKVLVIGRGTHDPFFPLWEFLRFDDRLTALGITHSTVITLGQGHVGNTFLETQVRAYIDALSQGKAYQPPPGRFIYIDLAPPEGPQVPLPAFLKDGLNADPKAVPVAGLDLPFAAEIPAGAGVGNPVDISVCGKIGSTYSYSAKDAAGKAWTSAAGTFDATECAHVQIKAPDVPGTYTWSFTSQDKPIAVTNTPLRNEGGCGLPAETIVTTLQPSPADLTGNQPTLGFGVDQYSAQEASCATSP